MTRFNSLHFKVSALSLLGVLCGGLFTVSVIYDFQYELLRDHARFRSGFPSQLNWLSSPYGTFKAYLFNVTNAASFLNGTDQKLKVQEVGPIVYHIEGRNEVLQQTANTLRYNKIRYNNIKFDADASISSNILNQTIIIPNFVLLSTTAKFHHLFFFRAGFNTMSLGDSLFIENSIYTFLWNYTTPGLKLLSQFMPHIVGNVGILKNALRNKYEEFEVKIGVNNGLKDFFHINTLNNRTYFPEQSSRLKFINTESNQYCPIKLVNAYDNSLFTPYLTPNDEFDIVAVESCRTIRIRYKEPAEHLGFSGYRYEFADRHTTPNCLDNSMDIPLPSGMFDVSHCVTNDVPAAFSAPHFYDTAYNWSQYIEGLSPNQDDHETTIILEPKTGIPLEEKYKFQYNIPMPEKMEFNKNLRRFNKIILPLFWYEYDLDDYPGIILFLMRFQIYAIPVLQPILMLVFAFSASACWFKVYLLISGRTFKDVLHRYTYKTKEKSKVRLQAETGL